MTTDYQEVVERVTCAVVRDRFGTALRSLILTGSLARREGTWHHEHGSTRLAGDAEFMVLFKDGAKLPSDLVRRSVQNLVEEHLLEEGIQATIGLSPVKSHFLRTLEPHIFGYELVAHGKTLWGDVNALDLAPRFAPSDIPLEDAFRLLMNRLIELLEALGMAPDLAALPAEVRYKAIKLCLDMATSYLLFSDRYESTYRGRAQALTEYSGNSATVPIPRQRFSDRTSLATRWKLGEDCHEPVVNAEHLTTLIGDVRALWRWELRTLTDSPLSASDDDLLASWLKHQSLAAGARGWAALAKRAGISSTIALLGLPAIATLRVSPRRRIYAAASSLFFCLPRLVGEPAARPPRPSKVTLKYLLRLPTPNDFADWPGAARAIGDFYHHFLEHTRS